MKKRVRNINTSEANKMIQQAHDYRKIVPQFKNALKSFEGMNTLEEIDEYLKAKTNFVNVELSATAMGLESEYKLVSKYLGKINLDNYDANGLVTPEFKAQCMERFTSYYSDEDVKLFDKIEKAIEKVNSFNLPNGVILSNHTGQLKFNERHFTVSRQLNKSYRGSSIVEKAE